LQPAKVELARLDGTILAEKTNEKLKLITELTGLDFGRFTKSMLLAQGSFAAFLNADANERAELLEELTGTDIYGRISEQVFSDAREQKTALELLQAKASATELLSSEQLQALTAELSTVKARLSEQQQAVNKHRQLLQWRQHVTAAEQALQQSRQEAAELSAEQVKQQSKLARLKYHQPASKLAPLYQAVQQATQRQQSLQTSLQQMLLKTESGRTEQAALLWQGWQYLLAAQQRARQQQQKLSQQQQDLQQQKSWLATTLQQQTAAQATLKQQLAGLTQGGDAATVRQQQQDMRERLYQLQQAQRLLAQQQRWQQQLAELQQQLSNKQQQVTPLTEQLVTLRSRFKSLSEQIADKKQLLAQQQLIMQLSEHRANLQPEQPCPLCGSTAHPAVSEYQQLDGSATAKLLAEKEAELSAVQTAGEAARTRQAELATETTQLQRQTTQLQTELDELRSQLQPLLQGAVSIELQSDSDKLTQTLNVYYQDIQQQLTGYEQKLKQLEQQQQQLQQLVTEQQQTERRQTETDHKLALLAQQQQNLTEQQVASSGELAQWQQQWQALQQAEPKATTQYADLAALKSRLQQLLQQLQHFEGQQQELRRQLEQARAEQQHASQQWQQAIVASDFSDETAFLQALLSDAELSELTALQQQLHQAEVAINRLLTDRQQRLDELVRQQLSSEPLALLQQQLQQLEQQRQHLTEQQGRLQHQLDSDQQRRVTQQSLLAEIEGAEQQLAVWQRLNSLIGSADGAKYRRFAQGLTLQQLVVLANRQLQLLHNRYQLARHPTAELELQVLDTWQADTTRDTKTLSGGESFLVSLALALALSDLVSSKTSIDSLFLDEGFGTLDADTLESALAVLDQLNASGKMIGIISHVEALKQRVPVQIRLEKQQGLGYSQIRISQ